MSDFEYKTICAPRKALKIKGVKGVDNRYAQTLTDVINAESVDGWEYFRAESLPVDGKSGMFGKTTEKYVSLLIFRREKVETHEEPAFFAEAQPETPPEMETLQSIKVEEEIPANVGSLGPATRD